jgi:hypothetical protein
MGWRMTTVYCTGGPPWSFTVPKRVWRSLEAIAAAFGYDEAKRRFDVYREV